MHSSNGASSLLGLVRVIDRRSRRHLYAVGRHPGGELVGELGALVSRPEDGSIPVWVSSDGRVLATNMPHIEKPSLEAVAHWVLEPRGWSDDRPAVRMRAMARRAQISLRMFLRGTPRPAPPCGDPAGYLLDAGLESVPLYGAVHPVTGDQLLTTARHEAERLGYEGTALLGYLAAAAPVSGVLGTSDTDVAWGTRGEREAAQKPQGAIDRPLAGDTVSRNAFTVTGWALWTPEPVVRVEIEINGMPVGRARMGLARPDVANHLGPQSRPNASICGFEFQAGPSALPEEAEELRVDAVMVSTDGERFQLPGPTLALEPPRKCLDDVDGRVAGLRARVETAISRSPKRPHQGLRILAFTHHLGYGGAQRYLFDSVKRLVAEPGVSCTVVAPATGPYKETFEALGVPVHVASYGGVDADSYEGRMLELAAWAAGESFDLVWANCLDSYPGADLGIRLDLPVVWSIHESFEIAVWWAAAYGSESARPYARGRAHTALREAGALIFAADATRRQYEHLCSPGRMFTFPYGFELDAMERYRRGFDPAGARERLGIAEDATVILTLGTIEPRKGQALMTQAFARVSAGHPDALLVLVGDQRNEYSAGLHEYLETSEVSDRIRVVPLVADPYEWHGVADLFVLASDVESLPIVILEAMAFETPVVATSIFGVPELIEDGVNGYLCEPSDLVSLSTALDRALSASPENRREIGHAGAQRMRARHDARTHEAQMRSLMTGLTAVETSLPADILAAAPRSGAHRSVPERVSVLIPTLDAGPEFERTLESIGTQEGLGALELVVMDSGSSDETVSLARASGARVQGIPAAEFNHGRVRNQLAEMATGDVLLMTVQDATLVGKHAIRDLVLALRSDSRLAAVSARQMARADADLYSKFLSWRRNEIMPVDSGVPGRSLARSAFLVEDVCAAIRRSAWDALRFRELPFAEDLDFGVRAHDAGWRTSFSDAVAVWHHHDRDAAYFLSRGAVHRHTMADVLGDVERISEAEPGLAALAAGLPTSLGQLEAAISQAGGDAESVSLAPFLAAVVTGLRKDPSPLPPTGELASVTALFVDRAPWEEALRAARDDAACAALRRSILHALEFSWLRHYALAYTDSITRDAAHAFVARCAASNLGEVVGDAMRDASETALAQRVTAAAGLTSVDGSSERAAASLGR